MSAFLHVRVHLIWSTRNREARLKGLWRSDLCGYIHGICESIHAPLIKAGGIEDHLHLYVSMPATITIAELVKTIKANSSRWVHENHDPAFAWQTKYAAFSVSKSTEAALLTYIKNQEEHHRHKSYVDELVEFLNRHGIAYDPQYYLE
ncbi:MAG: IS200/IS605 family transposase [Phycisphaeraceae bacterium]